MTLQGAPFWHGRGTVPYRDLDWQQQRVMMEVRSGVPLSMSAEGLLATLGSLCSPGNQKEVHRNIPLNAKENR